MTHRHALIIGAGSGLSAALARRFAREGLSVSLAARDAGKLAGLAAETGAEAHACDAADRAQIAALFARLDAGRGAPDVLVYNPSGRAPGPFAEVDGAEMERAVAVTAFGAFHAAQEAVKRMRPQGRGALLFTGASAGVKGYPRSAAFAMGKFALRGLCQSLARELHPQGIHVGHVVIDGGVRNPTRPDHREPADKPDSMLDPDAIAETYWRLLEQPRSAWAWEIALRPWVEPF